VHFGELLTYYSLEGIDKAVWICEESCKEHIDSLIKLNRQLKTQTFYLVSFKVGRLGSQIIVDFQVEVPRRRRVGLVGSKGSDVDKGRLFWTQLLEKSPKYSSKFDGVRPWKGYGLAIGSGLTGLAYILLLNKYESWVGFYLDLGEDKADLTLKRYEYLKSKRDRIETPLGRTLDWSGGGNRSTATVKYKVENIDRRNEGGWEEIQDSMLVEFSRLEKVLDPLVEELRKSG